MSCRSTLMQVIVLFAKTWIFFVTGAVQQAGQSNYLAEGRLSVVLTGGLLCPCNLTGYKPQFFRSAALVDGYSDVVFTLPLWGWHSGPSRTRKRKTT
eukprot:471073-Pelagomonas_calceolata.AAC.1